MHMNYNLSA